MGIFSKHRDLQGALATFREKRAAGVHANLGIYNSLMFLCCEEQSAALRDSASTEILNDMKEREIKYDETACSNLIRLTSMSGKIDDAMKIIQKMREEGRWAPKRRTYSPIFQHFPIVHAGRDLKRLDDIYLESEKDGVECGEDEFRSMLRSCVDSVQRMVESGASAASAASAADAKTSALSGKEKRTSLLPSEFFRITCDRMKEFVYQVDEATLDVLKSWCAACVDLAGKMDGVDGQNLLSSLTPTSIDQDTCSCQECHLKLHSIDLTSTQNETVLTQIVDSLASDGGGQMNQQFDHYMRWISRMYPKGVEVVIDGANVGYFGRRPPKDSLNFQQIDRVVRAFTDCERVEDRKTVLLILHQRHFKRLTGADSQLVDGWKRAKFLYQTPHRMNDDWFWLWVAVWSSRLVAQPFVITNDQMRDHHFQMLSQRHFLKWRERHVVRFGFERLHDRQCPPTLWFPLPYSTQIHTDGVVADKYSSGGSSSTSRTTSTATTGSNLSTASTSLSFHFPTKISKDQEGEAEMFQWYCLSTPGAK